MKEQQLGISVIIPAYNEGVYISAIVKETAQVLDKLEMSHEIIVVDDGSADATGMMAEEAGAQVVVRHQKTLGKGASIKDGFTRASGSILVILDADGSYAPHEIMKLAKPVADGKADVVIGSRSDRRSRYYPSFTQRVNRFLASILLRMFTGLKVRDPLSSFGAYSKKAIDLFEKELKLDNPATVAIEILMRAAQRHFRIVEIPINYRTRESLGYGRVIPMLASFRLVLSLIKLGRGYPID